MTLHARARASALAVCVLSFLVLAAPPVTARTDYVESLVAAAHAQRLSTDTTWLRLGHYRKGTFGGYASEADGTPFFLSSHGKEDPTAELDATIRGFFQDFGPGEDAEHPLCRFPARFLFLNGKLGFDPRQLPHPDCRAFRDFATTLDPESVTIVFSSYYLNNPSSSFGHTFLRINKRGKRGASHNDLLDYGIDYSASVDTTNAVLYAFKGVFGLFPGTFRRLPYYLKVREYNDYESRDLWEYDLNLSQPQVALVVSHLWELGSTYFAYFYLSENCSYHVLGALEVADPKLQLLEPLHWPVLPADTVKVLFRNPGLVRDVHFRPSGRSVFEDRLRDLTPEEKTALGSLVVNADAPLPPGFSKKQRVGVLDAALDLSDSKYARDLLKSQAERDQDAEAEKQRLLERRAEEMMVSDEHTVVPPLRSMPHLSHGARRFDLGPGHSQDQGYYQAFRARFALHDLADPARGMPETMQIEFLPIALRYYVEKPHLEVEEVSLIRITSLNPWSRFTTGLSWNAHVGTTRIRDGGCNDCLAGAIDVAGGAAFSVLGNGALLYAMANAEVIGLSPISGGVADLPLRLGVGPLGGLRLRFTDDFVGVVQGTVSWLPTQGPKTTYSVSAALRYQYLKDFAVGLEGRKQPTDESAQLMSYLYF